MSLAQGRPYLAIPGPSVLPDRVLAAMQQPAPNIYQGPLLEMTDALYLQLRALAAPGAPDRVHPAIYIANGHGAWEAANTNLFSRGDRALVLATGAFGTSWANTARRLGVEVEVMDFGRQTAADPNRLEAALKADRAGTIRAVLVTHTDTSSSVKNDIAALRAAIDAAGHPALFAVDCIASMGCDAYDMAALGVDVTVAASQKGLMTPPGLGLLWVSDKALKSCASSDLRTPYWDWTARIGATEYWQLFAGTAPTHHLFALSEALTMIGEEGLPHVWDRHARLARAIWAAVETWGQGGDIALNVPDPAARGHSVTAVRFGDGVAGRLRAWTEAEAGVTLGIPLGAAEPDDPAYQDFLRIGHMGHVNAHMVLGALAVIEAGLQALGAPHGAGAIEAAAKALLR